MRAARSLLLALAASFPLAAQAATVRTDYGIWISGFPVGKADLATTVEGSRYRMQLQVRLTGLAGLLTGGRGSAVAAGAIGGGQPAPASFSITSRSGENQRTIRMGLAGGAVSALEITPPIEEKADRVPLRDVHKRGVTDPVSSLLMPAVARGDLADPGNCNRTIPVFDGGVRFDIILSYAETRQIEKPGYKGPVLVCNARYRPLAGHKADRPATKFMEDNRDMNVWLAPVEGARVLLPIRIEVLTSSGKTLIEASRWTLDGAAAVAPASVSSAAAAAAVE